MSLQQAYMSSQKAAITEKISCSDYFAETSFRSEFWRMFDQLAKGETFEKNADKKLSGCACLGFDYYGAAYLYEKAANCYKSAQSWNQAGAVYVKRAQCLLQCYNSVDQASEAYENACRSYKRTNTNEYIAFLEQVLNIFIDLGKLNMYAGYCKEIAELYEQEQNLEQAITYYDKAADNFEFEEDTHSANQCKQKIAQISAQLGRYEKAITFYEEMAIKTLKKKSANEVRGHLLNAGICELCKGGVLNITTALERYQDMDPTFSGTCEYRLLADLAAALDEEDIVKFTDVVKMYKPYGWKTSLLLRVKLFKAKEGGGNDVTILLE